MKTLRDITLKNTEGNIRKDPEHRVFKVALRETTPTSISDVITEDYTLERINLLIANTEKDLKKIEERLVWAKNTKEAIEEALHVQANIDFENTLAEPDKKNNN